MTRRGEFHVIIIGAGTTGLLIAQGLKQRDISFSIFEREDETTYKQRPRDWTMALYWGSDYIPHCLPAHLVDQLPSTQTETFVEMTPEQETQLDFINGKTGEVVATTNVHSTRRVVRRKLRELFGRGLDVQYGKRLALVELSDDGGQVTAHFDDGSSETGSALIGCDGVWGPTRGFILPEENIELEACNHSCVNITQSYTAEQARLISGLYHPITKIAIHPDERALATIVALDMPDAQKPEEWIFQTVLTKWGSPEQPESNDERHKNMVQLGSKFCEPFKTAFTANKEEHAIVYPDKLVTWKHPAPWENHGGRISLAGDAAHPMSPFRGQGLNNALEDAASYVKAIKDVADQKQELSQAVHAYDKDCYERGVKEIQISLKQAYATHHIESFLGSVLVQSGTAKVNE